MKKAVLVEPEIPENTGFIARLAHNFDFHLRIVNPGFNLAEARETAKNAQQKLREAEIFEETKEAIQDLDYVVGTKPGRGQQLERFKPRKQTSVMLGRESSGLSNSELEMCDAIVHIETGSYPSLNLSHAAAIIFHSMSRRSQGEGISRGAKKKLEQLTGEKAAEAIIASNPSQSEINRILGELK
ncbi:MAG: RNA methyltransferase [Candidatus Nanohaloarchaea archaeon]